MRLSLALIIVLLCGCASSDFTVTLFRATPSLNIAERYSIDSKGSGTKVLILPSDTNGKRSTHAIDATTVQNISHLIQDSSRILSAIELHDTGTIVTGLEIEAHGTDHTLSWKDVDPPKLSTNVLDSLYHLMLRVEAELR